MGQEMTVQAGTKEIRIRYNEPCFSPYECDQTLEPDSTDSGGNSILGDSQTLPGCDHNKPDLVGLALTRELEQSPQTPLPSKFTL